MRAGADEPSVTGASALLPSLRRSLGIGVSKLIAELPSGQLGQLPEAFTADLDPVGDLVEVELSGKALDRQPDLPGDRAQLLESVATGISLAHDMDHASHSRASPRA